MKRTLTILLICSVFASAHDWTKADTARELAVIASLAIDHQQTRQIAAHPERWHEHNPIMGKHPSKAKVDKYFAIAAIAHVGIAIALPPKQRKVFQYATIGVEAGCIANNYRIGVRIKY